MGNTQANRAADPGPGRMLADAVAAQRAGNPAEAVRLSQSILDRSPDLPDAMQILAVGMAQLGRIPEATSIFRRALAIAPNDGGLHFNFGILLNRTGDTDGAERAFRAAIAATPDHVEALYSLGHLLQERGDLDGADGFLRRALTVRPLYARAWSALAANLKTQGRFDDAIEAAQRAIALNPNQVVARVTLANIYRDTGRAREALELLRAALTIEPDNGSALAFLHHQLQQCCDWRDLAELGARLDAANEAAIAAERAPPEPAFAQLTRIDDPARNFALVKAHARAFDRIPPMPPAPRATGTPIRIAYLGNDLQDHPVGQLLASLLPRHDRQRFHVTAYGWGADDGSETRRRLIDGLDSYVDIGALDRDAAAHRIRSDGIDILIDTKGQTQGHRLDILARRPAPVQATFLGFPGGTGATFIDYVIADRIVLPPAHRAFFTEQPAWLPHSYMPPGEPAPTGVAMRRADWNLPEDGAVLASFNNGYKIEPVLFDAWMRILAASPGAVLWLHRYNDLVASNLQREARARGIDPSRIVFADRPDRKTHLARLALADLTLDTRLFNGHVTSLDALRAGVPVVAMLGNNFASRVAASLLTAAGLADLIAADVASYETRVLDLLRDRAALASVRERLGKALKTAPLFDAALYARDFDRLLIAMADRHRAGQPPAPLEA